MIPQPSVSADFAPRPDLNANQNSDSTAGLKAVFPEPLNLDRIATANRATSVEETQIESEEAARRQRRFFLDRCEVSSRCPTQTLAPGQEISTLAHRPARHSRTRGCRHPHAHQGELA